MVVRRSRARTAAGTVKWNRRVHVDSPPEIDIARCSSRVLVARCSLRVLVASARCECSLRVLVASARRRCGECSSRVLVASARHGSSSPAFAASVRRASSSPASVAGVRRRRPSRKFVAGVRCGSSSPAFVASTRREYSSRVLVAEVRRECSSRVLVAEVGRRRSSRVLVAEVRRRCSSRVFVAQVRRRCASRKFAPVFVAQVRRRRPRVDEQREPLLRTTHSLLATAWLLVFVAGSWSLRVHRGSGVPAQEPPVRTGLPGIRGLRGGRALSRRPRAPRARTMTSALQSFKRHRARRGPMRGSAQARETACRGLRLDAATSRKRCAEARRRENPPDEVFDSMQSRAENDARTARASADGVEIRVHLELPFVPT